MPSTKETREYLDHETYLRGRLAVPAFAGGFLYLLSTIIITSTLNGAPKVGLVQALTPALSGEADPAVSPRAQEVKFASRHAFALIAGGTLAAIAIAALTLILLLLVEATRFRRPNSWRAARPLVLGAGVALVLLSIGHEVVVAIETHKFATGHDFSHAAVTRALTGGTANETVAYLALLAALAMAAGMIGTVVNGMRVGLLPRWMGILGIVVSILILDPELGGATLAVVPAFWMVMMGVLYGGRWPNGEPPAWTTGEARPWPSQAQMRAEKRGEAQPAVAGSADVAPAPAQPASGRASRKRRRKRGARGA